MRAMLAAGAERLKAWHGRKVDGFALWGLHDSACAELAEAAALCVEAFKTFSIELSGSAAAKVGSQPAATAFSTVANYLQSKVRRVLVGWSCPSICSRIAGSSMVPAKYALRTRLLRQRPEGTQWKVVNSIKLRSPRVTALP